jgi:hypothetical protein
MHSKLLSYTANKDRNLHVKLDEKTKFPLMHTYIAEFTQSPALDCTGLQMCNHYYAHRSCWHKLVGNLQM